MTPEEITAVATAVAQQVTIRSVVPMIYPDAAELLRPGAVVYDRLDGLERYPGRDGLQARYFVDQDGALRIELWARGSVVWASVHFAVRPST